MKHALGLFLLMAGVTAAQDRPVFPNIFAIMRERDRVAFEAAVVTWGPFILDQRLTGGITPLHVAAALNQSAMAALLLDLGADPEAPTDGGFTPLHWAAGEDAATTAALLLKRGAAVNAATPRGITPLHWAAGRNATNALRVLVAAGAVVTQPTEGGATPLHWAVAQEAEAAAVALAFEAIDRGWEPEDVPPTPSDRLRLDIAPEDMEFITPTPTPDEPLDATPPPPTSP